MTETIDVETLRTQLEDGASLTVLDVRPAEERTEWAIPGSRHVDAYEALKAGDPDALAHVDLPSDRPVVTVCAAGKMSRVAADQLRSRGLQALSLEGGMQAWSLAWNTAEVPLVDSSTRVLQVRRTGKGCLSYVIGSDGGAVVVDAALAPEVYQTLADRHGWTITDVIETHVHADHLSRGRQLAERTGATLRVPAQDRVTFEHEPIRDGDVLTVGSARIEALHTPGHTPESTCFRLDDEALITGDTLFLAGVGRPDLDAEADEARERAGQLHESLQQLQSLGDTLRVLPGHTGEPVPFDGVAVTATLGEVRDRAELLATPKDAFVETLLDRVPTPPPNHERIVKANEAGRLPETDPVEVEGGPNRCAVQ